MNGESNIAAAGQAVPVNGIEAAQRPLRDWLTPLAIIIAAAGFVFLLTSLLDHFTGSGMRGFVVTLVFSGPDTIEGDIANLAEVLIGVLGLTLTVVAIVVQLASQRYTPKLIDLFIEDRVNILTFLAMVSSAVYCIWIVYSVSEDYTPVFGALALMVVTTLLLALLIPYFRYVFQFLTPTNILDTIQRNFARAVHDALSVRGRQALERQKNHVTNNLEQVADIALSAVNQVDRNLSLLSIDTLCHILMDYLPSKSELPDAWYKPRHTHFISISAEFFEDISDRRLWVEARGMMDLELIFTQALRTMPDAISAIATNVRQIAITALENDDDETAYLCIEYMNTFLRRAINDKNQRAVFSLFYQYRRLAEGVMGMRPKLVEEIAFFFTYYGQESMRAGLPFLMIVTAMDMGTVIQRGYALGIAPPESLLDSFLRMGRSPELEKVPFAHKGVTKAQLILATHLMSDNQTDALARIQESLTHFSRQWVEECRDELMAVTKPKFWEITDRGGINFEYLEPEMKEQLQRFHTEYLQDRFST